MTSRRNFIKTTGCLSIAGFSFPLISFSKEIDTVKKSEYDFLKIPPFKLYQDSYERILLEKALYDFIQISGKNYKSSKFFFYYSKKLKENENNFSHYKCFISHLDNQGNLYYHNNMSIRQIIQTIFAFLEKQNEVLSNYYFSYAAPIKTPVDWKKFNFIKEK